MMLSFGPHRTKHQSNLGVRAKKKQSSNANIPYCSSLHREICVALEDP